MGIYQKKWGELTDKQKSKFSSKKDFITKKADISSRSDARERVSKKLAAGKNVNVSKIAKQTGVSEQRAQIIVNRGGKTKQELRDAEIMQNNNLDVEERAPVAVDKNKYGKKEIKEALNSGQSTDDIQKQINSYQNDTGTKVGLKAQAFLLLNLDFCLSVSSPHFF